MNPSWFRVSPELLIIIIILIVAFTALVVIYGIRAHRQQVSAGREDLIGKMAEASTVLEPKGTVLVQGERWAAISDKGRIEPGEEVIITKVEGLKLRVTRKE